jgi:putative hydrolase of the HAD superfamily
LEEEFHPSEGINRSEKRILIMGSIKAILLDGDGLLLEEKGYFDVTYSKQFGVNPESLKPFFRGAFQECIRGKADLKEELAHVLKDWDWKGSVEELMEYWFSVCTTADFSVMKKVQELRGSGVRCYIASNQEKYRGQYIQENLNFKNLLDGSFCSYESGYVKSEKEFFEYALNELQIQPLEVLFLDNEEKYIELPKQLGMNATLYTSIEDLNLKK